MKPIRKSLILPSLDYYTTHLSILNPLLPLKNRLTPTEVKVLACLLSYPTPSSSPNTSINSLSRRYTSNLLNITNAGLSNHLRSLTFKDIITNDSIIPLLIPDDKTTIYTFKLTNYGNQT